MERRRRHHGFRLRGRAGHRPVLQRAALVGLTAGVLLAGAAARAEEPPPAAAEQRPPERTLVLKGGARVTGAITTADGVTRVRMRSATLVAPEAQVDRIVDVEAKPAVETPGAPAARREELRLNPVLGYAFVKSRDFTFLDDAPRPAADFALLLPKLGLEVVLSVLPDATPEVVISEGTLPLLRDDLVKRETALATAYTASESFVGEVMGQKAMVVRAKVKPLLRDKEMLVRETADWKAGGFKFRLVAECDENAWPQAQPVVENIRARFFALERREFSSEWRPNYDFGFEVEIPPDWEGRTESSDDGRSTRLAMLSPEGKADVTIEVEPAGRPQNIMTLGQARAEEMQGDRARWDGFASKSAGALSMFGVNAYQIEFAYVREGEHRYGKEVLFEFDNLVYHLRFTSAAERAEIHAKSVQVVYDSFALYRNLVSAEAARRSAEAIGRYEEALRFVKARKMEEAAALLEKVTTDAPRFADAWRVMAEVRLSQNRIPEAATLARKARGAYREHPGIRELLAGITLKQADLAFREKRLDDAEKLFAEAAETTHNPKVEETGVTGLCGVGQQYAIAQPPMLTEAAATYQHAVKLAPENVKAKQGLADTYIKVANAAVAKENFSAARSAASKAVAAYKGYKPAQILEDSIDKKEEAARKRREAEAKRRASGK